jgi:tetratricopeptide (TPR) repeat protein
MGRLIELFPEPRAERRSLGESLSALLSATSRRLESFSVVLALSFVIHALVLGYLVVQGSPNREARQEVAAKDLRLFAEALESLIKDDVWTNAMTPAAAAVGSAGTLARPKISPSFGPGLNDREKVEIFKGLLTSRSIFPEEKRGTVKDVMRLESGEKVFISGSADGSGRLEIHKLKKDDAVALDELRRRGDYVRKPPAETTPVIRLGTGADAKDVPAEYFYRDCPYEEMLARGAGLFSVVTGFPDLSPDELLSGKSQPPEIAEAPAVPQTNQARFNVVYLPRGLPASGPPRIEDGAALPVSGAQVGRILDGLMAFPEEEQFARFEKDYLAKYDLNDENLARLTRDFLYANINGAFFIVDDLTSAFDSLEELFYKKSVFEKLDGWRRKAPRSKTAAELLFCLASAYDFEKRIIHYLAAAHPEAKNVLDGQLKKPSLFNPGVKAYVAVTVCRDLLGRLARGGFSSLDEAISLYTEEQLRIYDSLLGFGGETRNRALLAAGCLLWQEGETEEAIKRWRQIDVTSKVPLAYEIRRSLENPWAFRRSPIASIDEDLARDSAKNTGILHQRAVKFRKWSRRSR